MYCTSNRSSGTVCFKEEHHLIDVVPEVASTCVRIVNSFNYEGFDFNFRLSALMPPDNSSDFDMHLERSLVDLKNLRHDLSYEVFMLYCQDNIPNIGEEQQKVAPRQMFNDLQASGFKV